jgi:hypothetical protein
VSGAEVMSQTNKSRHNLFVKRNDAELRVGLLPENHEKDARREAELAGVSFSMETSSVTFLSGFQYKLSGTLSKHCSQLRL